jgi:hypothetical protein
MQNRANRKPLNRVMKKALTQVGAFLVNHNAVRFEQESVSALKPYQGVSMTGITSKSMVAGVNMHRNSTKVYCPVKSKYNPLESLLYLACRAFFVRVDLNLKSNMKSFTGKHLKTHSGIPHQINNSQGWYQNVPFGGGVLNPRYKAGKGFSVTPEI